MKTPPCYTLDQFKETCSRLEPLTGIFGKMKPTGGFYRFVNASLSEIDRLLDIGVLCPADRFNNAPAMRDFTDFLKLHPKAKAIGYVIGPPRDDCRAVIEGITMDTPSEEDRFAFARFLGADEYENTPTHCRAWYD